MNAMDKERFDYGAAVKELETIAAKVEDPATGIDETDSYIRRSEELIAACRAWLREAREKVASIDEEN